ncbi:hypothetical protein IL306_009842 [Fusarium sp. DS 682]|nr:hypothetical protein IL306_009842 [Fusarium sp. DS 682]
MADNNRCGNPHKAKLHLSGFRQDQLKMNIGTCQETDWISAVFTRQSSKSFLGDLGPFFNYIESLRENPLPEGQEHDKIRIAVLDSGIDESLAKLRFAIKAGRINRSKSKSFVDRPESWRRDSHGHGSHIAQLLLQTAPAAEIYVGKICTGKVINKEYMPAIADVGCFSDAPGCAL